jgi:heptosyltransferase-2
VIATNSQSDVPRYFVARASGRAYLRALDALLALTPRSSPRQLKNPPRRVLVAVGGQLGDAVLATGVFSFLETAIPGVELGVVSASIASVVFQEQPGIRWIHTVDHWKQRRQPVSLMNRVVDHWRSWRRAVREISEVGYDAAIDLYPFYPNMATALWAARVPRRIGFASGGGARLFTDALPAPALDRHVVEHHATLASRLVDSKYARDAVTPSISSGSVERKRGVQGVPDEYVVVHMGAGSQTKEWPLAHWRTLIADLHTTNCAIVLTGRGQRERAAATAITAPEPTVIDLVDRLEWPELVEVIRNADGVVSPDTAVAHIAAAVGTPNVVIWAGMNDPRNFGARSARTAIVMHPVPCAPCFRREGCSHMSCIRGVTPADVRDAMSSLGILRHLHRQQPA